MRTLFITCLLLFLSSVAISAGSEQDNAPARIKKKVTSTIDVRQETQKKEDVWASQKGKLTARYRSLQANLKYLKKVKTKTEQMLRAQEKQVAETERMIKESARVGEELQSYLVLVVERLEERIEKDIPFLLEEREERLASIKEVLALPDKPLAEKYRRVMEALQIEAEYGRTVEVYQDTINFGDRSRLFDVLRAGRLSLFCRTTDGKLAGIFNQVNHKWVVLPSKYRRDVGKGIEIANRERSVDLIKLPIGRIIVP